MLHTAPNPPMPPPLILLVPAHRENTYLIVSVDLHGKIEYNEDT
jgi:hypothetical protein